MHVKSQNESKWVYMNWEDDGEESEAVTEPPVKNIFSKESKSVTPSISSYLSNLDQRKIYWNEDKEIYVYINVCVSTQPKRSISPWSIQMRESLALVLHIV